MQRVLLEHKDCAGSCCLAMSEIAHCVGQTPLTRFEVGLEYFSVGLCLLAPIPSPTSNDLKQAFMAPHFVFVQGGPS